MIQLLSWLFWPFGLRAIFLGVFESDLEEQTVEDQYFNEED